MVKKIELPPRKCFLLKRIAVDLLDFDLEDIDCLIRHLSDIRASYEQQIIDEGYNLGLRFEDDSTIWVEVRCPESDTEYNCRIAKIQSAEENKRQASAEKEFATYQRLKKKFERQ